ncbi:MAG: DUF1343 domain-containing protein [candidate division KSB1 bacterium]|nr:DUF1343 domain-containing protein [candidate division KSB1 bacterium]MDZ7341491.1 DUF1343 domain-containing protein [candidate division KSB1 bacterium]
MKKEFVFQLIVALVFNLSLLYMEGQGLRAGTKLNNLSQVKPGIDVLIEKQRHLIEGKRLGLITNPTGITRQFKSTIDALNEIPGVKLVALFGPEHGVRGDIPGGERVSSYQDKKTGITVYSLYGETYKPTPEMLNGIDVLLYDIQDIGSRAYTYIYTMAYAMEAARDARIPFVVLDRPNPLGGNRVEGNVLDPKFKSFIGLYPIPYIYGMTVGELAQLFNKEFGINCNLTVVPLEGWTRDMTYEDTGLMWVPTSPHVPHPETAYLVAAIGCIGELGTISEGVGTPSPFEFIGAPWMDGDKLAEELNARKLPGVYFRPTYFRPFYLRFIKEQCGGVQIHILDKTAFEPAAVQVHILTAIKKLFPEKNIFDTPRISSFDRAYGTDEVRKAVLRGDAAEKIIASWQEQLEKFKRVRTKYLIY